MPYSVLNPVLGLPQQFNFYNTPDTTPKFLSGAIVAAVDPYWGGAEFIYARANGAIRNQGLVMFLPVFVNGAWIIEALEVTNTANLSRAVGVCMGSLLDDQYGWFLISGLAPINGTANVAAGTSVGITAAGQIGANSAGKQVVGAVSAANGATTVVRNGQGPTASKIIVLNDATGFFPGAYVSGTGVGVGALVTAIYPDNRTILVSVDSTAVINGPVTATYNNATIFYNVVQLNRSFAQGRID